MDTYTFYDKTLPDVTLVESERAISHKWAQLDERPIVLKAIVNNNPGRVIVTHGNKWGGISGYSTIKRVISHQHNTVIICCYAYYVCEDNPEFTRYMDNPNRTNVCIPRYTDDKKIIVTEVS